MNGEGRVDLSWRRGLWAMTGLIATITLFVGCVTTTSTQPTPTNPAAYPTAPTAPARLACPADAGYDCAGAEVATIARIVDGDTLELGDGRRVRVLGIDSCETGTYGGTQAQMAATTMLGAGQSFNLVREPGVDADRYGRLLRYVVDVNGADFGLAMVGYDHTGVYQGRGDASAAYLQRLYAADLTYAANPPAGRVCEDPYQPPPPPDPDPDTYRDPAPRPNRDDVDAPRRPRTGNSGHPCLPGERDGDGDGYCGEGR